MTSKTYKQGDKALINGAQIAEILSYSVEANVVEYRTANPGGSHNTTTAHISNTRIEDLPGDVGALSDSTDSKVLTKKAGEQAEVNEKHRAKVQSDAEDAVDDGELPPAEPQGDADAEEIAYAADDADYDLAGVDTSALEE